jgi:hypothetical protein
MRTVYALPPEKAQAVAEETLHVWCTMAEYLGWHGLKSEMEDLCFAVLQTEAYCRLRLQLDRLWDVSTMPQVCGRGMALLGPVGWSHLRLLLLSATCACGAVASQTCCA